MGCRSGRGEERNMEKEGGFGALDDGTELVGRGLGAFSGRPIMANCSIYIIQYECVYYMV